MTEPRWKQRFENLTKAYKLFIETCSTEIDNQNIYNMALVQSYEIVFELSWKTLKDYLEFHGITDISTPREVIKEAFKHGLIQDGDTFIEMLVNRNLMSHTYDDVKAEEIIKEIKDKYRPLIETLYQELKGKI